MSNKIHAYICTACGACEYICNTGVVRLPYSETVELLSHYEVRIWKDKFLIVMLNPIHIYICNKKEEREMAIELFVKLISSDIYVKAFATDDEEFYDISLYNKPVV